VFRLVVSGPGDISPAVGSLTPTIQRTIRDPIQTGGCPQCGTFLYDTGRSMQTEQVIHGRNWEDRDEDDYIRCARCSFPVKVRRHPSYPEGSWVGWGLRYDEQDAGPGEGNPSPAP
jgi:hypothetical protein